MIYTGDKVPKPMSAELPNRHESGMRQQAIRVRAYDRETALDPRSRLDFFDLHEFDYNHYFKFFGTVHEDSRPHLIPQFNAVRAELHLSTYQTAPLSAQAIPSHVAPNDQATASQAESSRAAVEAGFRKVTEALQTLREFARTNGYTVPTLTTVEARQYAQDDNAYRQWVNRVRAGFKAEKESRPDDDSDNDNSDEDDSDEEEEDDDDDDEENNNQ